jgi:competence protein ComEC
MRRRGLAKGLLLLAVVAIGVVAGGRTTEAPPEGLCLTALDVGQGDALLLQFPEGLPWLVDGGGIPGSRHDVGLSRVLPALRARGIDRLGLVVMTHGDVDHAGGLFAVIEHIDVDALLVPRRVRLGPTERSLVQLARERGVDVLAASEGGGLPAVRGGVAVELLHPSPEYWTSYPGSSTNDGSIVLRAQLGSVAMLLTGDIEGPGEDWLLQRGVDLRATVLKVGHHGSRSSSSARFLDAVGPLLAVAGIGADNRFGFPHQGVVARLRAHGASLFWTGRHGEVRVCTDGVSVVTDHRDAGPWEPLRRLAAAEVAAWTRRVPPPRVIPAESASAPPRSEKTRARRKPRDASRPRARKATASSRRAKEPATPAPPRLIDDREWERSRRERTSKRPPWRSRR